MELRTVNPWGGAFSPRRMERVIAEALTPIKGTSGIFVTVTVLLDVRVVPPSVKLAKMVIAVSAFICPALRRPNMETAVTMEFSDHVAKAS